MRALRTPFWTATSAGMCRSKNNVDKQSSKPILWEGCFTSILDQSPSFLFTSSKPQRILSSSQNALYHTRLHKKWKTNGPKKNLFLAYVCITEPRNMSCELERIRANQCYIAKVKHGYVTTTTTKELVSWKQPAGLNRKLLVCLKIQKVQTTTLTYSRFNHRQNTMFSGGLRRTETPLNMNLMGRSQIPRQNSA